VSCGIEVPQGFKIILSLVLGRKLEVCRSLALGLIEFLDWRIGFLRGASIKFFVFTRETVRLFEYVKKCETVVLVYFITSIRGCILIT
jgi:hypothetical protein